MPLTVTAFEIKNLVAEVMAELEPIIRRSNLRVAARVGRTVPRLRSDRQKVKQILVRLLSNALKFTPQGSVTVVSSFERRSGMVHIAVKDTGVGVAAEDQAKVFEDFRQLDSSPARGYGGTGLGLSICRRLSQMLGGSVTLESTPEDGATFTLSLPVKANRR